MARLLSATAVCFTVLSARLFAAAPVVPDYKPGDTVTNDIVAPFRLTVMDPKRTEALREYEVHRVLPVFRFHSGASNEAVTAFRSAFAETRERFLDAMEAAYKKRVLTIEDVDDPRFSRQHGSYQKRQTGMPISFGLGRLWAVGDSGSAVEEELIAQLVEAMGRVIIESETLPDGQKLAAREVRLVPSGPTNSVVDLPTVEKQGRAFRRTNLTTLNHARFDVQTNFVAERKSLGRFLSGFVQKNCWMDPQLTRQAQEKKTNELRVIDNYEAGQIIAKAGIPVDGRIMLALQEIKVRNLAESAPLEIASARREAEEAKRRYIVGTGIGLGVVLLIGTVVWRRRRRNRPVTLMPVLSGSLPTTTESEQAAAMMRAGLMPHLARWMSLGIFRGLLQQRSLLLAHQRQAELEIAQLEERLSRLHVPLKERLEAYEERILELETQLNSKTEENRELIRAAIATVRKKIESERANQPTTWN